MPRLRQLVHDMGDDVGAEAFIRQQTAVIGRPDSRPTLAAIKCPTLVLTGDQDNTIPNSLSMEMAERHPGAKLVIVPHCGHLPQPEQPQATGRGAGRMAAGTESCSRRLCARTA